MINILDKSNFVGLFLAICGEPTYFG